jgi:hypothetical protein
MIEPVLIEPTAVFDDGSLYQVFGLSATTLAAARRAGKLRYVRQGHRVLYLGAWVLDWLNAVACPAVTPETGAEVRR